MADDRRDSEEFEQITDRDKAEGDVNSGDAVARADDEFEDLQDLDEEEDEDKISSEAEGSE